MNYIVDQLDLTLLQFGPLDVHGTEISLRQVNATISGEQSFLWLLKEESELKNKLKQRSLMDFFANVSDAKDPELIGFNPEDQVLVIVHTPDNHLTVAQTEFRFFLFTFKKRDIPCRLIVAGVEQVIKKTTE